MNNIIKAKIIIVEMDLNWGHALILLNSQYGNWNIMLTCLMPSLYISITTKGVFVCQVNSLDFEWIHWLHQTEPNGDIVNSLV
jgi:hypothetical protein